MELQTEGDVEGDLRLGFFAEYGHPGRDNAPAATHSLTL